MTKYLKVLLLGAILLFAFALRLWQISEIPPALNWDEVSIAYNAYSVLKTGRDEWGQFLPLQFKAFGEYKLPVHIYASIPGIMAFGLTEMGVRITPVVYGTLTVLLFYLLAYEMFKSRNIGLLSAFLLAVSPWHIHLTRASFESSFSVFWVTLGAWLAVKGLKNSKYLIASTIPFALAVYTYNSARIFVPLFVLTAFIVHRREILKFPKAVLASAIIFLLFMLPIVFFWFKGDASARLKLVSFVDDPGFVLNINQARGLTNLPEPLPRVIHNKATHFVYRFSGNYLAHFSPDFLFVNGAPHKQHHVQRVGQFYLWQAPFFLIGLYYLLRYKHRFRGILISWILLAFIPVAITGDSIPHALRTLLAIIPYELIMAYGAYVLYLVVSRYKAWQKIVLGVLAVLILSLSMKSYLENYYTVYPKLYSRDWQYGYKEVVAYIKDHYTEYDLIVFSRHYGEPHIFTLFFMGWDPVSFQSDPNLDRFETYDWVRVLKFDKFYFPDLGDQGTRYEDVQRENPGKKLLFIGKQGDFPQSKEVIKYVDFLNGDRAFELVEVK